MVFEINVLYAIKSNIVGNNTLYSNDYRILLAMIYHTFITNGMYFQILMLNMFQKYSEKLKYCQSSTATIKPIDEIAVDGVLLLLLLLQVLLLLLLV